MTDPPHHTTGFEESLTVMDIADRMRLHDHHLAQVSDLDRQREALRSRLSELYARQGIQVDARILEKAIDKRLAERLTHEPARGVAAALARAYVWLYDRC